MRMLLLLALLFTSAVCNAQPKDEPIPLETFVADLRDWNEKMTKASSPDLTAAQRKAAQEELNKQSPYLKFDGKLLEGKVEVTDVREVKQKGTTEPAFVVFIKWKYTDKNSYTGQLTTTNKDLGQALKKGEYTCAFRLKADPKKIASLFIAGNLVSVK